MTDHGFHKFRLTSFRTLPSKCNTIKNLKRPNLRFSVFMIKIIKRKDQTKKKKIKRRQENAFFFFFIQTNIYAGFLLNTSVSVSQSHIGDISSSPTEGNWKQFELLILVLFRLILLG